MPYNYYICYVTLENFNLSHVPVYMMSEEQLSMYEHALTAAISRVRNKIETLDRQYIKTVYGMGYMWIGGALK